MDAERILEVEDLETQFRTEEGLVKAVDRVSFVLHRGETLGIVGESGCGKSVTNLSILQLLPARTARITGGRVLFRGRDLRSAREEQVRVVRGRNIAMIFQDPLTSLNPLLRVWVQIAEALQLHQGMRRREARAKAVEMLKIIGIPDAERRANDYPHQFSGGMRQRVMIAMALSCNPDILIADEPTTALDVTIQAQILDLISSLSARNSTAVILITHDLGVVAGLCQTVCVMYAGHIVEKASVDDLFSDPLHPYTRGLLASIPRVDRAASVGSGGLGEPGGSRRLTTIPGSPPSLIDLPDACPFHPRCPNAMDICRSAFPPERERPGRAPRTVSCWLYAPKGDRAGP
ncbi:MAG TPA: ABC transporter ATP-binding protein [Spirochaetia bacterium]|nr:ABC transporter ATP-binding protein [Spirochaetia bacterium]